MRDDCHTSRIEQLKTEYDILCNATPESMNNLYAEGLARRRAGAKREELEAILDAAIFRNEVLRRKHQFFSELVERLIESIEHSNEEMDEECFTNIMEVRSWDNEYARHSFREARRRNKLAKL